MVRIVTVPNLYEKTYIKHQRKIQLTLNFRRVTDAGASGRISSHRSQRVSHDLHDDDDNDNDDDTHLPQKKSYDVVNGLALLVLLASDDLGRSKG